MRQGWPAAFEAVYNRHHRGILSFCRHVLSDADEAEDAVQHTFLAAYNDLIASDKPIHLRAWLFTIARNRCYSILRSRREQPAADLDEPVTEGLATQVQRRQDLRDLVVDLRGLPDEQRAALVLAELDALSHEEIGEALGVPREKVKALVFQARESLVASRTARETACADIREQLSVGRGGTLRRANLRRHLRDCAGCRDYRRHVERQRRQLAALLPVVPTLALKQTVLAGTGTTAGFGGGGLLASSALKSGTLKGFATLILATAGTAGTYVATHAFEARPASRAARAHSAAARSSAAGLNLTQRAAPATPSIDHEAVVTAPASRALTVTGSIRSTTPAHVRDAGPNSFGPLVYSRAGFPRKTGSHRQAIAPPKSNGQAPSAPTLTPVTVFSVPVATISSTLPPPSLGDVKPVSDRPSTAGNPASSTGNARGVTSSGGASRSRAAGGRTMRGPGDGRRSSSGRASGRPIRDPYPSRVSGDGRSAGASTRSPGSTSAPAVTKPRVAPGDATAAGSADSATKDGHGTDLATAPSAVAPSTVASPAVAPAAATAGQ